MNHPKKSPSFFAPLRLCVIAFFCASSLSALEVTNVTARQRWPWNNLVDIDFVLNTNGTEGASVFAIDVTGTYAGGEKTVAASTFLTAPDVAAGTNRVTWNLGTDYPGFRTSDLALTVTASAEGGHYLVIDLSGGTNATSYPFYYTTQAPNPSNDLCKTDELWLRWIQAGSFIMGTPTNELGRTEVYGIDTDADQKSVVLSQPYYVGVFQITQRQWYNVMGMWPSYYTNELYRDMRPVEQVTYDMIRGSAANGGGGWPTDSSVYLDSFVGRLRQKTGLTSLDLPTEAQWEYACRAGTTTALYSGVNLTNVTTDANVALLARYRCSQGSRNSGFEAGTFKVGAYLPNTWGLYDMYGNVMDWCLDWYKESIIPGGTDPGGNPSGTDRVRRGGMLDSPSAYCRSGFRWKKGPSDTGSTYGCGFRIAKQPE